MPLHKKQIKLIDLLTANQDDPLTIRALQEELGLSSPSLVHHHITQLEKKGFLKRNPSNPRDYQVLLDPEHPVSYVNLYGMAKCGPAGTVLSGSPLDMVPIYSKLIHFPVDEAFMVKATGDSMEPKIHEGDIVIARKQKTAEEGQIIICSLDSSVMIKRFSGKNDVILESLNNKYYPIIVQNGQQFYIEGVMKGLISFNENLVN